MEFTSQFISAMNESGIVTNAPIISDGELHRFHIEGDSPNSLNGWYTLFGDGVPSGAYGCWKRGINKSWCSKDKSQMTSIEWENHSERISMAKEKQLQLKLAAQEQAHHKAVQILQASQIADNNHEYLIRKQVPAIGIYAFKHGNLIVPIYNVHNQLCSLQFISPNGAKKFLRDGSLKGNYFVLGEITDKLYVTEGYSTGATINIATGCGVIVAFNAGNLLSVIRNIQTKFASKQIILAADNDQWPNDNGIIDNVGCRKAQEAANEIRAQIVFPDFTGLNVDSHPTDFNDLKLLAGIEEVRRQLNQINSEKEAVILPHNQILQQLLTKISPIDFRLLADLPEEKQLLNSHYQILSIEEILKLAKVNNWGICRNHDFIYLFNGSYWSLLDIEELKNFLGEACEKLGVDKFKAKYFNFREQLFKQFIALANLPKPEIGQDVVNINLQNGTFKITPDGTKLCSFDRADFITYQLPFAYDLDAKAPLFEAYINKVLPDKERQNILAEYLGYVFIKPSALKLEKTLLLYGTGANGKSVFYEIVRNLLGEQNTSEYSLQSLTNDNGYYRAMIANKLVNYASEINGRLEASIFKQLVSGEPVEARLPYGNPFTLTQYAKLIFNCNELPKDVEQTEAYFRRFLIIPFEVTIPEMEQDKQLAHKIISNELSGVFNWVLQGLNRLLIQKKFTDCQKVREARELYERESDSVRQFIYDGGYKSSHEWISIKILYQDYRSFCIEDGFKPVSKTNFIKRLVGSKLVVEKRNIGNVVYLNKH